jgi:hypothetical protein
LHFRWQGRLAWLIALRHGCLDALGEGKRRGPVLLTTYRPHPRRSCTLCMYVCTYACTSVLWCMIMRGVMVDEVI